MAVQTIYLLGTAAVTPNWFGNTQLNGSAPTAANSAFGWTAAKTAPPAFWRGRLGATAVGSDTVVTTSYNAGTSGPTKGTGALGTTAGDSFIAGPFTGVFAATAWTLNFNMRAGVAGAVGHVNVRIWKSANADGTSATQLAANTAGVTVTLTTTSDVNSSISWSPGALTFNNEYIFFQVEWQETTAGSSNSDNVFFRVGTSSITTANLGTLWQGSAALAGAGGLTANATQILGQGSATLAGAGSLTANATQIRFSPVKLLLHCDGTSGSSVFTDSSYSSHVVTAQGSAQIDTSQSEFGGASGYFSDSSGADYLSLDSATDFTFGTGDFTIDFWVKRNSSVLPNIFMDFRSTSDTTPPMVYYDSGGLHYYCNSADQITYATSLTVGTWYHVAVARSGSNTKLFLNGTQVGSTYVASDNLGCATSGPQIGASPAPPESETTTWIAAVGTAGGSVSSGRQTTVNALIKGLKTDGVWSKLDRLWLFAAENTQSALLDLKGLNTASAVSAPTFTANRGFNGDGSSSYIDTTFNPVTNGVNFNTTTSLACGGYWDITTTVASNTAVQMGSLEFGIYGCDCTTRYIDGNCYFRINSGGGPSTTYPGPGLFIVNRSSTTADQLYWNGSSIASSTAAAGTSPSRSIYVDARNNAGSAGGSYALDQIAAVLFGGSLTATDHSNLYARLRTYMTAVGVP